MSSRFSTKYMILLHILLFFYSGGGIISKLASQQPFLSFRFCLYYGCMALILGIYAIGWQQIIKHIPLTTAYANKAVTVVWGAVWGLVIFREQITLGKLVGSVLVIIGVVLYATAEQEAPHE